MPTDSCPACAAKLVAPICSPRCEAALRTVRGMHPTRKGNHVIVERTAPFFRMFHSFCPTAAVGLKNINGDLVLPVKVVDGVCASIAVKHIGPQTPGQKRARETEEEEARKESRVLDAVKHDLEKIGELSADTKIELANLPVPFLLHLLPFFDYYMLVALRGTNREFRQMIDSRNMLFNFGNTKYLLSMLMDSCLQKNLATFEACVRACARVMPALLPTFVGAMMSLCFWVPGFTEEGGENFSTLSAFHTFLFSFFKKTEEYNAKFKTLSITKSTESVVQSALRILHCDDEAFIAQASALHLSWTYVAYDMHHSDADDEYLHLKLKQAYLLRGMLADVLEWLYFAVDGPRLDAEKTFFASCWIDSLDASWMNKQQNAQRLTLLPKTAGVAMRIMTACEFPQATASAFITSENNPICFTEFAALCAEEALLLAQKADCLHRLVERCIEGENSPISSLWREKIRLFYVRQPDQKWVIDIERLARVSESTALLDFSLQIRAAWRSVHTVPLDFPLSTRLSTGGIEPYATRALVRLDMRTKRMYGIGDEALLKGLFHPNYTSGDLETAIASTDMLDFFLGMAPDMRRRLLQSIWAEFLIKDEIMQIRDYLEPIDDSIVMKASFNMALKLSLPSVWDTFSSLNERTLNYLARQACYTTAVLTSLCKPSFEYSTSIGEDTSFLFSSLPATLSIDTALIGVSRMVSYIDIMMLMTRKPASGIFSQRKRELLAYLSFVDKLLASQIESARGVRDKKELYEKLRLIDYHTARIRFDLTGELDSSLQAINPQPEKYYGVLKFLDPRRTLTHPPIRLAGLYYDIAIILDIVAKSDFPIERIFADTALFDMSSVYVLTKRGYALGTSLLAALQDAKYEISMQHFSTELKRQQKLFSVLRESGVDEDIVQTLQSYDEQLRPLIITQSQGKWTVLSDGTALVRALWIGLPYVRVQKIPPQLMELALIKHRVTPPVSLTMSAAAAAALPPSVPPTTTTPPSSLMTVDTRIQFSSSPISSSVVVTTPHAACDAYSSLDHMCDSTAERMARLLRADHVFVNTDVSRRVLDMNRPESRDTAFRRAISATPADVLVDVHSFPPGSFGDADFVIMEPDPEPTPAIQLLIDRFQRTDLVGRWVQGSPVNSILAVAREQGITASFLLEVKEELSGDQMKRLADVINGWAGIV